MNNLTKLPYRLYQDAKQISKEICTTYIYSEKDPYTTFARKNCSMDYFNQGNYSKDHLNNGYLQSSKGKFEFTGPNKVLLVLAWRTGTHREDCIYSHEFIVLEILVHQDLYILLALIDRLQMLPTIDLCLYLYSLKLL